MAVGDVHLRADSAVPIQDVLWPAADEVDLVLLTGDMTDNGRMAEVEQVARVMGDVAAPIYAVMGNHDRRTLRRKEFRRALSTAGVKLLDGESTVFESRHGLRVGL
ncbi:MAG: metallophosphoesterase, partial [Chloroflexota bacterium]|nr:metallophosphoesterase [Chloroflexota bacterium]